ncbi:unnamed protein product [Sphagnum jensenii]|uniref:Uncharacterized protein n=1 Tax=Sphagnum jensenii TaxID=128206 RepID=A0ABP1A948_9BRYO
MPSNIYAASGSWNLQENVHNSRGRKEGSVCTMATSLPFIGQQQVFGAILKAGSGLAIFLCIALESHLKFSQLPHSSHLLCKNPVVQAAAKHWGLASEEDKPEREVLSELESKAESLQIPHNKGA